MGGTLYSDEDYKTRGAFRTAHAIPTFAYSSAIESGAAPAVAHTTLDPKTIKVRESRDSEAHPNSNAVIVLFDVTGSMQDVPEMMQEALCTLMGLLIRKSYLVDPAILVGAIGDQNIDLVPFQAGQFESGIEIENDLTNLFLEGGGGGNMAESYDLGLYFAARKTSIDCFEKRGKKGHLILIGDEQPEPFVRKEAVKAVFGDTIQENIPIEQILAEAKAKYHVTYIIPAMTNHYSDPRYSAPWKKLLGQDVVFLEDPKAICETIAARIGLAEGTADLSSIEADLADFGTSATARASVGRALATIGGSAGPRGALVTVPDSGAASGLATL